jgi:hypothetical protein
MDFTSDLPTAGKRPPRWHAEAAECRSHPGQWGLLTTFTVLNMTDRRRVGSHARMVAHHIRTGRYVAFRPAGSYESSSRSATSELTGEHSISVYVRYVAATGSGQAVACEGAS